jgi:hypothetical protein
MVIKRRYNVDSSVTSCLKVRIASRKSSFLLFKQTCSHDFTQAFLQEHNFAHLLWSRRRIRHTLERKRKIFHKANRGRCLSPQRTDRPLHVSRGGERGRVVEVSSEARGIH